MATLNKHGVKLAEIERLTSKVAYMSDGKILRNQGDGWKLYRHVKPGVDIAEHAASQTQRYADHLSARPMLAACLRPTDRQAYRKALHDCVCFSQPYMVSSVLEMLANDPDGVWSELNDMLHIPIDLDDCVELCRAYESAAEESKRFKATKLANLGGAS